MTHLCVAIFVQTIEQARRDMALAAEAGADFIELRIDRVVDSSNLGQFLASPQMLHPLQELIGQAGIPTIITCRAPWEGGESTLAESDRIELLKRASEADATYVDLELVAYRKTGPLSTMPRDARAGLIVSSHDFAGRPARLTNLIDEINQTHAEVAKVVWTARSVRDNIEAFEILLHRQKPTIALCMGEAGLISRVLSKKFGGFLTFASLSDGSETAPGQVTIREMKQLYRWDAIKPETKVFGVIGSPIMHSMSPAIHNASFDKVGYDGVYLPFKVEPGYESFKAFMEMFLNFEPLHLSGLSVTIPHKENALRYLQEAGADIEPLATAIGAVNTVAVSRYGGKISLRGINTDYAAILDSITAKLDIDRGALAGYRIAVIGAGGTGRTAVAALVACGATVVVYNRTKERADALAEEFNGRSGKVRSAGLDKLCDSGCDIFINTTSVGMYPKVNVSPLGEKPAGFSNKTLVFDTIYNPVHTQLLQYAQMLGAKTISGVEMFVRQAARQFELWTDQPAPVQTMRRIIEQRLRLPK